MVRNNKKERNKMGIRIQEFLKEKFYFKILKKNNKSSKNNILDCFIIEENKVTVKQEIYNKDNNSNIYQAGRDVILNGKKEEEKNKDGR